MVSDMHEYDEELARQLAVKLFEEAETKRVFKEALSEWMDKKFLEFGSASLKMLGVILFAGLVVFIMWTQGYHK